MYGRDSQKLKVEKIVENLSTKYPSIDKDDHKLIVSTTLDNYFSEKGIKEFYKTNFEKLKIPVVMKHIKENTHNFFYIESHCRGEDMYRMLDEIPLTELQVAAYYNPEIDPFAGLRQFAMQYKMEKNVCKN